MVTNELLAGEHRRIVDRFVEDAANLLSEGLEVAERNQLEVDLRFYVETQLVPGLLAVHAVLLGAPLDALNTDPPEWIERTSSLLPAEAAFLTEAGRGVDPVSHTLLAENLGMSDDQCLGVTTFHDHLSSLLPLVAKPVTSEAL